MQRLVPTSPTTCSMRYEVYRNKNSSDAEFETIHQIYKSMMSENKDLSVETQKNLNTGVSTTGQLNSMEERPVDFQTLVRGLLAEHHKREEDAGEQIWPARQRLPKEEAVSKDDMDLCSKLTNNDTSVSYTHLTLQTICSV